MNHERVLLSAAKYVTGSTTQREKRVTSTDAVWEQTEQNVYEWVLFSAF